MNSETRFVLAVVLMLGVLVGTSYLFAPPEPPPESGEVELADTVATPGPEADPARPIDPDTGDRAQADPAPRTPQDTAPQLPPLDTEADDDPLAGLGLTEDAEAEAARPAATVRVESPLYTFSFSTEGARLTSAEINRWNSFTRPGPVELVEDPAVGLLANRLVVGADTVDLRTLPFEVEPAGGLVMAEGDGPQVLTFRYTHPDRPFGLEVRYTFDPGSYVISAQGRVRGFERGLLLTDLGRGLPFNEVDVRDEARAMAYATNHTQNGINSRDLSRVDRSELENGPFHWAAVRSRYFVVAFLPTANPALDGGAEHLGGLLVRPVASRGLEEDEPTAEFAVSHSLQSGGTFAYRVFAGPQDYALLSALGNDLQEVNPVGWRFLRPLLRPFVAGIMWVLVFLHTNLALGYGWVLILFGIMMRVVLFPLYHKAMRAQLRNMAVQPLLKEIQTKHKDNPEKMQKELMKLYKEHGFNPLAGCWPMLLPWPILIALFFVFQNTIELRGVPFAWLPDLSAKDPFFILPVLLGVSMFLLQWISIRSLDEVQPQMKMLMYVLPVVMVVIFANFPSGLNLYYLTANVATLPQSWWIANERKKMQGKKVPVPAGSG
jgi:YidC/Oxa1 family membrane protein insertase